MDVPSRPLGPNGQDTPRGLVAVFEQSWENARHIKNERLTFTNMFSVICAGVLSMLNTVRGDRMAELSLLLFLCFFSSIGLLTSLRLKAELEECLASLERLAEVIGAEKYMATGKSTRPLRWYPKFRWVFPMYYSVATGGFLWLLVYRVLYPSIAAR